MTYQKDLKTHYSEVRARLMGKGKVVQLATQFRLLAPERPSEPVKTGDLVRRRTLTKEQARYLNSHLTFKEIPMPEAPWKEIIDEVSAKHGLKAGQIMIKRNSQILVNARAEAYYRIREELSLAGEKISYPRIGQIFNQHHSTVLYGYNKFKHERKMGRV